MRSRAQPSSSVPVASSSPFDEVAILDAIRDEGGSEIFLVPTMIKRLIEHPRFAGYDTAGLGLVIYGAAAIDGTLLAQELEEHDAERADAEHDGQHDHAVIEGQGEGALVAVGEPIEDAFEEIEHRPVLGLVLEDLRAHHRRRR